MKFAKGSPIAVWVLVYWAAFTSTSRASRSGPRDDILRFIQDLNDDFNSLKIEYANLVEELNDLEISLATQAEFLRDAVTGTEKEEIGFAIADQGKRIEELEATVTMQKSTIDMLVEKERQRALLHQGNDKILVDGESSGEREQSKRAVHTEEGRWMSNIRTLGRRDSNTVAFLFGDEECSVERGACPECLLPSHVHQRRRQLRPKRGRLRLSGARHLLLYFHHAHLRWPLHRRHPHEERGRSGFHANRRRRQKPDAVTECCTLAAARRQSIPSAEPVGVEKCQFRDIRQPQQLCYL
ncbi:uncharacterized protein [Ptychodera flava]|uniref:uncharacterized protein n=1 Tax=Ptychodera flava TaxID=63121 RepID=UPI003969FCB8